MSKQRLSVYFMTCFLVSPPCVLAATLPIESQITQVTVYPDSARVTRQASVSLPAGEHQLEITGLPLQIQTDSLRVNGEGDHPVSLGSVQFIEQIASEVVQTRERELQAELRQWQEKRQVVVDAQTRAQQQLEFIRATGLAPSQTATQPNEQPPAEAVLPIQQWQQAWQTLELATAEAQAKQRLATQTLDEFDRGIAQLQKQLEQIATGATSSRTATLYVETTAATQLNLNLMYQIAGATWRPVYEANLDSETGTLQLKTQAEIQQNTGEDWQQVQVKLSTLQPSSSSELPTLDSWVVGLYEPPAPLRMEKAMEAADASAMMEPALSVLPAPSAPAKAISRPLTEATSQLVATDYQAEYQAPNRIDLPSGPQQRRITLSTQSLNSELGLYSAPRFDPRAMVIAKAIYQQEAPLIAGSMMLYRDGNFIGTSQINNTLKGEELKLAFGEDTQVKIEFHPVPEQTRRTGIINSRKNLERHYRVSINNQHTDARALTLYDVIPVTNTDQVTIHLTGAPPSLQDLEDKKGVMAWIRNVSAQTLDTLEYGYVISYPQDKVLSGL